MYLVAAAGEPLTKRCHILLYAKVSTLQSIINHETNFHHCLGYTDCMDLNRYLNGSGWLNVGSGHKIYWEDWGNKKAKTPIFYLHGGPGDSIKPYYKLPFDPLRQHVIFYDQRGCGRSLPLGSLKNNNTQALVEDIDKLRRHLKIDKINLWGGSWGSTLALCYAIAHPRQVGKMLLWGIFLARRLDIDFLYQGGGRLHFPEVWQKYQKTVPKSKTNQTVDYYQKHIDDWTHAKEWLNLEGSMMSVDTHPEKIVIDNEEFDEQSAISAKIESYYMKHNCFISENYILKNCKAIKHIPTAIVHGRYDFLCPPAAAFELLKALGPNSSLQIVPSGHARDPVIREVLAAYTRTFL